MEKEVKSKYVSLRINRCVYEYYKRRLTSNNPYFLPITRMLENHIARAIGTWGEFLAFKLLYDAGEELPIDGVADKNPAEDAPVIKRKAAEFAQCKKPYKDPTYGETGTVRSDVLASDREQLEPDSPEDQAMMEDFAPGK